MMHIEHVCRQKFLLYAFPRHCDQIGTDNLAEQNYITVIYINWNTLYKMHPINDPIWHNVDTVHTVHKFCRTHTMYVNNNQTANWSYQLILTVSSVSGRNWRSQRKRSLTTLPFRGYNSVNIYRDTIRLEHVTLNAHKNNIYIASEIYTAFRPV